MINSSPKYSLLKISFYKLLQTFLYSLLVSNTNYLITHRHCFKIFTHHNRRFIIKMEQKNNLINIKRDKVTNHYKFLKEVSSNLFSLEEELQVSAFKFLQETKMLYQGVSKKYLNPVMRVHKSPKKQFFLINFRILT